MSTKPKQTKPVASDSSALRSASVAFTDAEYDQLAECLHIARTELLQLATDYSTKFPHSNHVEFLRMWADRAERLRKRIEKR